MVRVIALVFLLTLPSCIAAIGNETGTASALPDSAAPLLREKLDALRRIVALRQQQVDDQRSLHQAGRGSATDVAEAEIALAEANIRLLECQAELRALEARRHD